MGGAPVTDLADAVALAEDRSFAVDEWFNNLAEVMTGPVFDGTRWTFPVKSSEGEKQ